TILNGTTTSAFIDGPASGNRTLPDGTTLNLTDATNMVRCGKTTCSDADLVANTEEHPWGVNNPRWQLYAYGPLQDIIPTGTINPRDYVIVWVADDPAECDGDPLTDGGPPIAPCTANLGKGVLAMLAHAYGPDGTRRVIEVTVARTDTTEIE